MSRIRSFADRPIPRWFRDAGLGIFIHWGPFAVPAFAPVMEPGGTIIDLLRTDPGNFGAKLPYAEWYRNALAIDDSPTAHHHRAVWGDLPYEGFRAIFEGGLADWDPAAWADLFVEAGARYVVMVAKHADGYCLWPSAVRHPRGDAVCSPRDLVGEVAAAVRSRGLRFGVYYCTGWDWSVHHVPVRRLGDSFACIPNEPDHVRYVTEQLDELVDRVAPSVVWADVGTPRGFDVARFKQRLVDRVPDAVINDRWDPPPPGSATPLGRRMLNAIVDAALPHLADRPFLPGHHRLADFRTPEYSEPDIPQATKWETTRGLGAGFGHNANEPDTHKIDPDDLVALYRRVEMAGGNLLLNVGPKADGTITDAESSRVRHLGAAVATEDAR
ncbi:MAG: alpha-L-fucosidase [Actinobacteria bacterium]|nr:alpha-L-fucosidase [Actinomycetota bacterium]